MPDITSTEIKQPPVSNQVLPSPFIYTTPPPTLITQGAEALVYKTHFLDTATPAILKFRPSKAYRHPTLDARLTKARVLAEARVLVKLAGVEGVNVPGVLGLEWDVGRKVKGDRGEVVRVKRDEDVSGSKLEGGGDGAAKGAWILMEFVSGASVKELLRGVDEWVKSHVDGVPQVEKEKTEEDIKVLLRRIGHAVGAMHSRGGVVHGDLTSSNIMVRPNTISQANGETEDGQHGSQKPIDLHGEIVLIDFGLATQSIQDEDRAVDLYVLERAFGSTHPKQEDWFDAEVLQHQDGYRGSFKGANVVLKRLDEVRLRGRKRSMIG